MSCLKLTALFAVLALAPSVALAHSGHGYESGFMQGLAHPLTGIDHILTMIAVGLLAAELGGRTLWLLPLSFVTIMAIAGALAMTGIQFPFAEIVIALSVVVLGLAIASPRKLPVWATMLLVAFFGAFHGYAHGAEMPTAAAALPYGVGFVAATVILHATGVSLGLLFGSNGGTFDRRVIHTAGGVMALFGVAFLVSAVF